VKRWVFKGEFERSDAVHCIEPDENLKSLKLLLVLSTLSVRVPSSSSTAIRYMGLDLYHVIACIDWYVHHTNEMLCFHIFDVYNTT